MRSHDYALLAEDAYHDRAAQAAALADRDKTLKLGANLYRVLAYSDRPSGYQGVAYQRVDTGDIIVAHRGTEQILRDGAFADAGMVLTGANPQASDAIALTRHALEIAQREAQRIGRKPPVTVTGHSLGGCLAQITAHALGLRGETFNAYGAAGLLHGVPDGGTQVVNHVSAVDPIAAASRHFGEVRVYATAADIRHLDRHGYDDGRGPDLRAPLPAILDGHGFRQHGIDGFTARGLLDGANHARYLAHRTIVERYREDVHLRRTMLSVPWQPLRLFGGRDHAADEVQPSVERGHWDRRRERAPAAMPAHHGPPLREPARPTPSPWLREPPAYLAPQAAVQDPQALVERLLAAMEGGDERAFRHAIQAAAQSETGRTLRAQAVALADAQARAAALHLPPAPPHEPPAPRRSGPSLT